MENKIKKICKNASIKWIKESAGLYKSKALEIFGQVITDEKALELATSDFNKMLKVITK